MTETFGIGELAREFGVTPRTIRFYEDVGLLTPLREGQRRIYRARDRIRLKLILRGKRLGFRLADVQKIIDLYDAPPGEAGQLQLLRDKIAERRAELEAKRRDIEATLADLAGVDAQCQDRLEELEVADGVGAVPASRGSQGGQA
jgi:DNA-binding transcriptional MerR regulator